MEKWSMNVSNFREVNPILPVRDVQSSVAFYRDRLGFHVSFRDCTAPETYVGVRRGGVELHLQYQRDQDMPKPGTIVIRIVVDSPDAVFEEFRQRDVADDGTVLEDKPWGTREFTIKDPNGHRLTFYRDL